MKVYAFIYNSNIHESAYVTMSLHFTRGGANRAKNRHKAKELEQFKLCIQASMTQGNGLYPLQFGRHEGWAMQEINIEP